MHCEYYTDDQGLSLKVKRLQILQTQHPLLKRRSHLYRAPDARFCYFIGMPTQQRPPGAYTRHVAAVIRDHRERLGIDITELARQLSESGRPTHRATASRMESGTRAITVDDLEALGRVFGVAPAAFLPRGTASICEMYGHTWNGGAATTAVAPPTDPNKRRVDVPEIKKLPPDSKGRTRYRAVVDAGTDPETGKRRQLTVTRPKRKEVENEVNRISHQRDAGTLILPSNTTVTNLVDI